MVNKCSGGARGVLMTETLRRHSKAPIFEYHLRFENRRDKPVCIADYDGIIHARLGIAMLGDKRLLLPTGGSATLTKEWFSVFERDIPTAHRTWMVVRGSKYAVGLLNFSRHMKNWSFTKEAFWLYVVDDEGKRPIEIAPGGSVSFGVAFIVLPVEDAFEATLSAFKSLREGDLPPNPKLVVRRWQTLHPPHQGSWHPENLRCLRARYDGKRPHYEKFNLPDDTEFFSIDPTIACNMLREEYMEPVEYRKPPLKKPPYPSEDLVLIDYYHYLPLQIPNGVNCFFFSTGHWSGDAKFIESLEWAKQLKAIGFKKIVIHPMWKEDGRYRGCHWIDAIQEGKVEETKEAIVRVAKGWLSIVPDGEVYLFYPEVNSCYGHWGGGIVDSPLAQLPGYEKVREGGKKGWELCFRFFRELTDELKRRIGGKVKVIAQLDRAAFQGAYLFHSGADIVMHKNIHRQSINIVVANSRGAARAYDKEYGFDFDAWDRNYWWSYHHRGIWHGLLVYFHAGAKYLLQEVPTATPFGHGHAGKLNRYGKVWLDFCRYARMHPKRGEQEVRIAIMRALGDEWNRVAGPSASWEAGRWVPRALKERVGRKRVEETYLWDYVLLNLVFANYGLPWRTHPDRLCTGTPYGPVDFIPWDTPADKLHEYDVVIFLGHGIVDENTARNLERFVEQGGKLVLAAGQLRGDDGKFVVNEFLGVKFGETKRWEELPYTHLKPTSADAEVVSRLPNGEPMVVKVRHGEGTAYIFCGEWLTYFNDWVPTKFILPLLEEAKVLDFEPKSDWLEYMVQKKGRSYIFPIFNHGRGFFPSGNGRDYGPWEGRVKVYLDKLGLSARELEAWRVVYRPEEEVPFSLEPLEFSVKGGVLRLRLKVEEFEEVVVGPKGRAKGDFFGR